MNHESKPNSKQKRASLKRIRNAGLGTAAVASMGLAGGWIRPVVNQVMLPAHATTTIPCGAPTITVAKGPCSAGASIDITILASDSLPLQILSIPTLVTTPPSQAFANGPSWSDPVSGGAVPAEITDSIPYDAQTKGQFVETDLCITPATTVPNSGGQPLTSMNLTIEYLCPSDGTTTTLTVDILPQILGA